ncbi:hypothetical protein L6452_10143 [Arctium lappa]|uniref:Uncharacterized protein n=1 Tax=Arctium lappa TaxID=4217 RepID=A0ACB9DMA0_ARCLA|nr:hypothetical protein L6452_10143 [Arctium lappa]
MFRKILGLVLVQVPVRVLILERLVAMLVDYGNDDVLHARACDDVDLHARACDGDGDDDGDGVCAYVRVLGPEMMLVHLMVELKKAHLHHLCLVPSLLDWHKFLEDLHLKELYRCCYQRPVISE